MKQLLLLRHAKSDWSDDDLDDHARPLNARGRAAAARMGRYMKEAGLAPQLILCSTAARTCETLDLLQDQLACTPDVIHDRALYLAMPEQMLETAFAHIDQQADDPDCVLLIAHNPGTHSLALGLSRSGDQSLLSQLNHKFPTAALAVLECDGSWQDMVSGGRLTDFVMPRQLPDAA